MTQRRVTLKSLAFTALLALAVGLGGCGATGTEAKTSTDTADPASSDQPGGANGKGPTADSTVVRVVDGDTLVININGKEERVRMIGVDTPETKDPRKPVQCFGEEASSFTKSLLPEGTPVRLERDVEERDRFDRLLLYVYRADDNLFVNRELLARGYAVPLTIAPNVIFANEFVALSAAARDAGVGLWGACGGPDVPAG